MQGKDLFPDGSGFENPSLISGVSMLDLELNPSDLNGLFLSPSCMTPNKKHWETEWRNCYSKKRGADKANMDVRRRPSKGWIYDRSQGSFEFDEWRYFARK